MRRFEEISMRAPRLPTAERRGVALGACRPAARSRAAKAAFSRGAHTMKRFGQAGIRYFYRQATHSDGR